MSEEEGILKMALLLQQIRWGLEEHGPVRGGPEARPWVSLRARQMKPAWCLSEPLLSGILGQPRSEDEQEFWGGSPHVKGSK